MLMLMLFLLGLLALVSGAELLVRGASRLALQLGLSPLVVGLTVVAFGTSAPELAVTSGAVVNGQVGMAVGNAVGSNIFNVLFILGLAALITPLSVHLQLIRQEVPVMIAGAVLLLLLGHDGIYGLFDGVLLLGCLAAYTSFLVVQARRAPRDTSVAVPDVPGPFPATGLRINLALIAGGLLLLVFGADALVTAAVAFARTLGISEVVIGLTIVAAGTSLPEVAASIMASIKGERDIAVGNVVGSCVFNIFGVVGAGAALASVFGTGLPLPPDVARFDLWVMLAVLVACLPIFFTGSVIARWEGALFLLYYAAYLTYLIGAAQRHEGMEAVADAMLGFVIPLSVVTLGVALLRQPRASGPGRDAHRP